MARTPLLLVEHPPVFTLGKNASKQHIINNSNDVSIIQTDRVWEGEYVRLRSYKREISSWLDQSFSSNIMSDHISKPIGIPLKNNFVDIAEKIISRKPSWGKSGNRRI